MPKKRRSANNAWGTLATSISASDTTITLTAGHGARFPTLGTNEVFMATLIDTSNNLEIVEVTARASDTLTVIRGQEGTTARAYGAGDRIEHRTTKGEKESYAQKDEAPVFNSTVSMSDAQLREDKGANIVAAATTDLGSATGNYVTITHASGTLAITSLGGATVPAGTEIETLFSLTGGTLSLTHHATNLILPGSANLTLSNGDVVRWRKEHDSNAEWRAVSVTKANGSAITTPPLFNLLPNSDMSICTALPLTRVGSPVSATGWANLGVNTGNISITVPSAVVGHAGGITPGKLFIVDGAGTPRSAHVGLSATVTLNKRITAAAGSFTGVEVGDVFEITGGTNTSPKIKYRVTATDASTYVEGYAGTASGAVMVNEGPVTFDITWREGSKDVDPTVNGLPATGNSVNAAIIGYPLMCTDVLAGSLKATLSGAVLASAGSGNANLWEATPADEGWNGTGEACDGWKKSVTLRYWRTYDKDWDGITPVTKPGSLYGCKVRKGAAVAEYLHANLANVSSLVEASNELERLRLFANKKLTFGMYWWPAGANQARLYIYDGVTITFSDYFAAGGFGWKEVTATISSAPTTVELGIEITGAVGDTHYGTQPMAIYGAEIGEGNYVPTSGLHVFATHPNFYRTWVKSSSITVDTLIRIEQESIGALPRGLKAIHIALEGKNFNPFTSSSGIAVWESPNKRIPSLTLYDPTSYSTFSLTTGTTTVAPGTTRHIEKGDAVAAPTVPLRPPFSCKVIGMFTQSGAGPGGTETFTYTLTKNGVDTTMVCSVTGGVTQCQNEASENWTDYTYGADYLTVKVAASAGAVATKHAVDLRVVPTTDGFRGLVTAAGLCPVGKKVESDPPTWRTDCILVSPAPGNDWRGMNIDMFAAVL